MQFLLKVATSSVSSVEYRYISKSAIRYFTFLTPSLSFFTFGDGKVFHQANRQCFVILFYWISEFLKKRVYCFILVHISCLLANKLINDIYLTSEWQTSVSAIDYIISLLNQSSNTLSARNIPSLSTVIISLSTKLFFIRSIFDLLPRGYISETA